jgi:dihydroorotase
MMNRRQFICATATAAAMFARARDLSAATYDLVIKGGRVIDPSVGLDAVRDVAIVAGKIAAVDANIGADTADTIDARGKIVAPGLIDIHTHAPATRKARDCAYRMA